MTNPIDNLEHAVSADAWELNPRVAMLNHGSFGACPREILELQTSYRRKLEAEPVRFLVRQLPELWEEARASLASLLHVDPADLVFVRNVTEAVNAVLRSLRFGPGDEILVTDHGYNACRNVAAYVAERSGATLAVAEVPLTVRDPEEIVDRVLAACGPRVRLALLDHVTSPTALVFPIERLVHELKQRGVETLVDGAHAAGMVPLDLTAIGAAYYGGNGHKWLCGPKGVGFLHVRRDRQEGIEPAVISHGYNTRRPDQPRLHAAFDWTGTDDPSPVLCLAASIRWLAALSEDGLPGVMRRNHALAVAGRRLLCELLRQEPPCPEAMLGAMATIPLPERAGEPRPAGSYEIHPLQTRLFEEFGIEVPILYWPSPPDRFLRISAQVYNSLPQYRRLGEVLSQVLGELPADCG
jgi:isopenicillin-N epimerase